jgi:PAS domain S-box-containing protein
MKSPASYDPGPFDKQLPNQHIDNKLRGLFMQAPAAIALLEGPEHVYTLANPLYQKIFNRTEEQLIGKTPRQAFPEIENQGIYELFDKVYHTNQPFVASEFPATFQDGDVMKTGYYNFIIQPMQNEAGEVSDLMVHVYEVTGQVTAHKKIEESESKYRSLFNSMDQGFCVVEIIFDKTGEPVDYRFLEVNPVFESLTGLKDAAGRTARELVPGLEDHWFQVYGEVAITGRSVKFIQGSEAMGRWFEVNAFRLHNQEDKHVAILFTDITEKITGERLMQENKQILQTVFDASPNSLTVYEPVTNDKGEIEDFRFLMVNEFTVQTTGRTDLAGKLYAAEFPNARPSGLLDRYKEVALTGTTADFEQWYEGEGMRHWFRVIVNKVGKLLVVTTEDITMRKAAEERLLKSEQHFRQLTDTVPAIIWITRPDGYCTYLNKNWYDYTGQTEGEAEGFGWLNASHPDDAAEAGRRFMEATEKQLPYYILYRLRHKSGEYRWAIDSGQPRFSADGTFEGMIGTVIDVHEQKLAEDKIRESENRFRSIFQTAGVSIWEEDFSAVNEAINNVKASGVTNFSTYLANHPEFVEKCMQLVRITDVNDATLEMFEADNKAELLDNLANIFVPETMPVFVGELLTLAEGRTSYVSECRMKTLKGNLLYVLFSMRLPAPGNSFDRVLFTLLDITERKAAEEMLESLVVERTKELHRSNEDLQQFAHVASHDLKEPVRKVKMFTSRLEQHLGSKLDETGAKYVERIHSATDRMFTMIDGVLKYSTFNAATELFQPVDLNEVIKSIETDLEVIIQSTGTSIGYGHLPTIEGAPVLLYQVFYNLINNSIKFAKEGTLPVIDITSEIIMVDQRQMALLVLSDNGIGFEVEEQSAIFDTFTRLHSKDKYEGTGLGLALCKKIVERHGGSISAKGVPNEGASFTILLPLQQVDAIIERVI